MLLVRCVGFAMLLGTVGASLADAQVKAGVAQEAFELPRGVPLAGYSRRRGAPSRGLHDPVGVRALFLEEDRTAAILASCDLLIIDEYLFHAVRRRLIDAGLPSDLTLILAGTHTHSGPGAYGTRFAEKISMGHYDPTVAESLLSSMTRAILRAHQQLAPIRAAYHSIETSGLIVNRVEPGGVTDSQVSVVALYAQAMTTPMAVIVNFAAHPTTLGAWNHQLSADYPGVVVGEIERQLPGTTALFFSGAVGDQAPVKTGTDYEPATRLGQSLARDVTKVLKEERPTMPADRLRAAWQQMQLPPAQVRLNPRVRLPRWIGRRLVDDDATLALVQLGDVVFFGVPCDLDAELGIALKQTARSRGLHPILIGFANDYIGYCVSETRYASGAYEALMAFNGPTTGTRVIEQLTAMLDSTPQ